MSYSTGSINTILDFTTLFDSWLLANGWTKTTKSAVITNCVVNYTAGGVSSLSHPANAFDNVPVGAILSFTGIASSKVYIAARFSTTSLTIISDSSFTSGSGLSVSCGWTLYTKGTKNFTFACCKHAYTGNVIEYLLSNIYHSDTGFNTGAGDRGAVCRFDTSLSEFPANYQLFGNTNPDMVSVVFDFNNEVRHIHFGNLVKVHNLAFVGGEFITGSCAVYAGARVIGSNIGETTLTLSGSSAGHNSGGFFADSATNATSGNLHCEIDGTIYSFTNASSTLAKANLTQNCIRSFYRGLSQWNQQTVLTTIELQFNALANFKSYLGYIEHIRFVRTDNYNLNDTITLGADVWKIFPMLKKNSAIRNGNTSGTGLSGTLGFAVKYTP